MMESNSRSSPVASTSRGERGSVDNDNSGGSSDRLTTFPLILTDKYFKVTSDSNAASEKVEASCMQCQTVIKGSFKATSNFKLHLKVSQ
jgi:hypothetical protein